MGTRHRNEAAGSAGHRRIGKRLLAAVSGMALSLPAIALAQEADDATLLEAIVVTAGGYEQTIKEAPASISVIGQDDLKKKAVADLSEAIRTVPGVTSVSAATAMRHQHATIGEAQAKALELCEKVTFDGVQYRKDIGYRAIARENA